MKNLLCLFSLSAFLVACGGGGGGSSAPEPDLLVDDTNFEAVADSATEVTEFVVNGDAFDNVPLAVTIDAESILDPVLEEVVDAVSDLDVALPLVPVGAIVTETIQGDCGGSFTSRFNDSFDGTGNFDVDFDFDEWCIGESGFTIVYDGFIDARFQVVDFEFVSYELEYDLTITVTEEGQSETYSEAGSISCVVVDFEEEICTTEVDETSFSSSSSDDTYTVNEATLSGNDIDGYDYEATITSEEYGTFLIVGTDLVPTSGAGWPFESGTIEVIDSTGEIVIVIEFISSGEYTVTFDGVTETYFFLV